MTTHPPLYRQVLLDSWRLIRKHKILWAFGLFAAFLGSGGALEVWAHNFNLIFSAQPWSPWSNQYSWLAAMKLDLVTGLWSLALLLLLLGLAVFFVFVIANSFSNLIMTVDQYHRNKKIDFKKIWQAAVKKFWPVLWTIIFFKLVIGLFTALSVLPLWLVFINQAGPFLLLFYPLLFLICFLAVLISSFLMIYTANFILLEKETWGQALNQAWRLFAQHWLVNIEMAIIIFLINLLVGCVLIGGIILLFVPSVFVFLVSHFLNFPPLGSVAVFLGLLLSVFLILWVAALLAAFQISSWTLLFRRMCQGTAVSKLIRLTRKIFANNQ